MWKNANTDRSPALDLDPDDLSDTVLATRLAAVEKTLADGVGSRSIRLRDASVIDRARIKKLVDTVRSAQPRSARTRALLELEDLQRTLAVSVIADGDNPLSDPKTIAALNPTGYLAVTQFAQVGAWFRYVRARHPRAWDQFRRQVPPPTAARPKVVLPTCASW
jgi:hypothetical protein